MMNYSELIRKRESCRDYGDRKVERETLDMLVESARLSPSACNSQPWHFITVDDAKKATELAERLYDRETGTNSFTLKAPAFIVLLETHAKLRPEIETKCGSQHFAQIDIGSAAAYLTLRAADLGLSTCIMGWFEEEKIKKLLMIPEELQVRLVVAVGYAATPAVREKKRKKIEDILSYNQY